MKRRLWSIALWDILPVRANNTATPNSVHYSASESATAVIYKTEFCFTNAGTKRYVKLMFVTTQIGTAVVSYP